VADSLPVEVGMQLLCALFSPVFWHQRQTRLRTLGVPAEGLP
jgi:hypothetical protein